jgi:hypothetical protein
MRAGQKAVEERNRGGIHCRALDCELLNACIGRELDRATAGEMAEVSVRLSRGSRDFSSMKLGLDEAVIHFYRV